VGRKIQVFLVASARERPEKSLLPIYRRLFGHTSTPFEGFLLQGYSINLASYTHLATVLAEPEVHAHGSMPELILKVV
jgi:hypothetical protein